jgi:hypothetical protein
MRVDIPIRREVSGAEWTDCFAVFIGNAGDGGPVRAESMAAVTARVSVQHQSPLRFVVNATPELIAHIRRLPWLLASTGRQKTWMPRQAGHALRKWLPDQPLGPETSGRPRLWGEIMALCESDSVRSATQEARPT